MFPSPERRHSLEGKTNANELAHNTNQHNVLHFEFKSKNHNFQHKPQPVVTNFFGQQQRDLTKMTSTFCSPLVELCEAGAVIATSTWQTNAAWSISLPLTCFIYLFASFTCILVCNVYRFQTVSHTPFVFFY